MRRHFLRSTTPKKDVKPVVTYLFAPLQYALYPKERHCCTRSGKGVCDLVIMFHFSVPADILPKTIIFVPESFIPESRTPEYFYDGRKVAKKSMSVSAFLYCKYSAHCGPYLLVLFPHLPPQYTPRSS